MFLKRINQYVLLTNQHILLTLYRIVRSLFGEYISWEMITLRLIPLAGNLHFCQMSFFHFLFFSFFNFCICRLGWSRWLWRWHLPLPSLQLLCFCCLWRGNGGFFILSLRGMAEKSYLCMLIAMLAASRNRKIQYY